MKIKEIIDMYKDRIEITPDGLRKLLNRQGIIGEVVNEPRRTFIYNRAEVIEFMDMYCKIKGRK
jgi:hypothetical protein